jgi:hypothetical protein
VVVVVVETTGLGAVVVCSVVVVRVTGVGLPQPASVAVPEISDMPNASPRGDVVMFIV